MKVQARELFRAAKRLGVSIRAEEDYQDGLTPIYLGSNQSKLDPSPGYGYCARHVLNMACGQEWNRDVAIPNVISEGNLMALEHGFEGWGHVVNENNRYYKVGQNFRKMIQRERERQEAAKNSTKG